MEVILFPQRAFVLFSATVTDVRGFAEHVTKLFQVIIAQIVAKIAQRTAFGTVGLVLAYLLSFADGAPYAPIVGAVRRVLVALKGVGTYFTRDCRCAFIKLQGYLFDGNAIPQPLFDFQAFGVGQVFALGHVGFSFSKCVRKAHKYYFAGKNETLPHKMQPPVIFCARRA
jgi:hypothetical protein